jgi:mRNA interferase MazF
VIGPQNGGGLGRPRFALVGTTPFPSLSLGAPNTRRGSTCPCLTRDPIADRIASVVVAALTRTVRGLVSELELSPKPDGLPTECMGNFDNLHTISRESFRKPITQLSAERLVESCRNESGLVGVGRPVVVGDSEERVGRLKQSSNVC